MLVHRTPFFYGWVIVMVVMMSGLLSVGLQFWGFSVFVVPMEEELGWSRSTLLAAYAIGALMSVLLAPVLGPYGDTKYGPRIIYGVGAVFFALSMILMKYVDAIWEHYLFFGVLGGIGRYGIHLPLSIVPKWFVKQRGMALAWSSAGAGIGTFFVAYSIQLLIDAVGWRDAWMYLGFISLVMLLPGIFLLRTSPEEFGLNPDGVPNDDALSTASRKARGTAEYSFTRGGAMRTRAFWLVLVATTLAAFGVMGFVPNIVPFLRGQGFSATAATASITAYGAVAILMRFGLGYMVRRIPIRWVFIIQVAIAGVAISFLYTVTIIPTMVLAMALVGIGFGGFWVVQNLIVADYFGRRHISGILGLVQPFQQGATWGGPLVYGLLFDAFNGYQWVFASALVAIAFSMIVVYYAKPATQPMAQQAPAISG
ncbi:MAG: MFS transporter [Chloroflexi bacterium]|nr:MFS transporter [Chloroflexota bacterium]